MPGALRRGGGAGPVAPHAALVALVKAASAVVVLAIGFQAVSDDDFARVVIAEEWAKAPKLDPSGTSWLPLPFWIVGLAMRVFGRGIEAARGVSIGLGIASAALVYVAAAWIIEDRRAALAGSIVAAVFPWSARLGVATVPELPAAALALFGVASLMPADDERHPRGRRLLLGGAAIAASALSRYEAWPIAGVFAAIALRGALRFDRSSKERAAAIGAALIALAAPAAWIIWNRIAHGEALHFLARVAAYRRALGGNGDGGALKAIVAYPIALARHEPELLAAFFALAAFAMTRAAQPPTLRARLRRYALPGAVLLTQIALLSAAMVKDGAPTHHPERALLSAMLLLAIAVGDLGLALFSSETLARRMKAGLALTLAVLIVPTALVFRRWIRMEDFADRRDEVAVGRAAAELLAPGDRVLIEAADYGYFAVIAALARPEDAEIDRSIDPRSGGPSISSFDDRASLQARLAQCGARAFIARLSSPAAPAHAEAVRGAWGLFRASSASSALSASSVVAVPSTALSAAPSAVPAPSRSTEPSP